MKISIVAVVLCVLITGNDLKAEVLVVDNKNELFKEMMNSCSKLEQNEQNECYLIDGMPLIQRRPEFSLLTPIIASIVEYYNKNERLMMGVSFESPKLAEVMLKKSADNTQIEESFDRMVSIKKKLMNLRKDGVKNTGVNTVGTVTSRILNPIVLKNNNDIKQTLEMFAKERGYLFPIDIYVMSDHKHLSEAIKMKSPVIVCGANNSCLLTFGYYRKNNDKYLLVYNPETIGYIEISNATNITNSELSAKMKSFDKKFGLLKIDKTFNMNDISPADVNIVKYTDRGKYYVVHDVVEDPKFIDDITKR